MNWDAIGAFGEWVGALAVLITLVYLTIQIKQSARTQKAQTHQQVTHDRAQIIREFLHNRELRDAVAKVAAGKGIDDNERNILYWFTTLQVRAFENDLYQHSQGMIDDHELEVQRNLLELPHMQIEAVLDISEHTYTPEVQHELRALREKRKARLAADRQSGAS